MCLIKHRRWFFKTYSPRPHKKSRKRQFRTYSKVVQAPNVFTTTPPLACSSSSYQPCFELLLLLICFVILKMTFASDREDRYPWINFPLRQHTQVLWRKTTPVCLCESVDVMVCFKLIKVICQLYVFEQEKCNWIFVYLISDRFSLNVIHCWAYHRSELIERKSQFPR